MTRQVVEYTDLVELFLVLFFLICLVFFAFLFYFSRKYNERIEFLDKKSLEYNKNLLTGINILLEKNENILSAINNLNEVADKNQELALNLKSEYRNTHEYLISNNEIINRNSKDLVTELITLEKLEKENCKLLNILNRKIHNKPKIDNVQ